MGAKSIVAIRITNKTPYFSVQAIDLSNMLTFSLSQCKIEKNETEHNMTLFKRFSSFLLGSICIALPWYLNFQLHLHLFFTVSLGSALALTLSAIGLFLCLAALRSQPQASAQYALNDGKTFENKHIDDRNSVLTEYTRKDEAKRSTQPLLNGLQGRMQKTGDSKERAQGDTALPLSSQAYQRQNPNQQELGQTDPSKPSSQLKIINLARHNGLPSSSDVSQVSNDSKLPRDLVIQPTLLPHASNNVENPRIDGKANVPFNFIDENGQPVQSNSPGWLPAGMFHHIAAFLGSPHNDDRSEIDRKAWMVPTVGCDNSPIGQSSAVLPHNSNALTDKSWFVPVDEKGKTVRPPINADRNANPPSPRIFSGLPFASPFPQPPSFLRSPHNDDMSGGDRKVLRVRTHDKRRWRQKFKRVEFLAHIFAYAKYIKDGDIFKINQETYVFYTLNALRGTGVYGNIGYATTRPRIYLNFQGTKPAWLDTVIADIRKGGPGFQAFKSNRAIILNQIIGLISGYRYPEGEEKESKKIDLIISGHSLGASLSQLCFYALLQEIANEKHPTANEKHPTLNRIGRIEINIANDPGVNEDVRNEICRLSKVVKNMGISLEANIIVVDGDAIQQAYPTAVGYLGPDIANVELMKVKLNPSSFKWEGATTMAAFLSLLQVGVLPAGILAYLGQCTYRKLLKSFYAHTKKLLQDSENETDIECFSNQHPSGRNAIIQKCARKLWGLPWLSRLSGPLFEWLHHQLYQQHGMIQDDRALRSIILKRKEGWTEVEIKSEFNKRQDLPALNWPPLSLRQALSSELKKENEDLLLLI